MNSGERVRQTAVTDWLRGLREGTAEEHRQIEQQPLIHALLCSDLTLEHYRFILEGFYVWYAALDEALERSGHLDLIVPSSTSTCRRGTSEVRVSTFSIAAVRRPPEPFAHNRPGTPSGPPPSQYVYTSRRDLLARDLATLDEVLAAKPIRSPIPSGLHQEAPAGQGADADEKAMPGCECGSETAPTPAVCRLPAMTCLAEVVGVLYVIEGATQGGRIIAPKVEATLGLERGGGTAYFRRFEACQWNLFRTQARLLLDKGGADLAVEAARQTFNSLHQHLDCWNDLSPDRGFPRM